MARIRNIGKSPERFQLGITVDHHGLPKDRPITPKELKAITDRLIELGVDHVRFEITMRDSGDITTNPKNNALQVVTAIRNAGIDVVPVVGVGNIPSLPDGMSADDPDYLEKLLANVREVATVLKPLGIKNFQIENELNAAGLATLPTFGWRKGEKWWDPEFKVEVLSSLRAVVKEIVPEAKVHSNFHDLVSDPIPAVPDRPNDGPQIAGWSAEDLNRLTQAVLKRSAYRDAALRLLAPHLDEVGVDFYPNYTLPHSVTSALGLPASLTPLEGALGTREPGKLLAKRVRHYARITNKSVRISETGYPSRRPGDSDDADGQIDYIRAITQGARDSGAKGLTYFRLSDPPAKDGGILGALDPNVSTEPYFGLLDADGKEKDATVDHWEWKLFGGIIPYPSRVVEHTSSFDAFTEIIAEFRNKPLKG